MSASLRFVKKKKRVGGTLEKMKILRGIVNLK
jgi:hypothetical protein